MKDDTVDKSNLFITPENLISVLESQLNPCLTLLPDQVDLISKGLVSNLDISDAEKLWRGLNSNFKIHLEKLFPADYDEVPDVNQHDSAEVDRLQEMAKQFLLAIVQLAYQAICVEQPSLPNDLFHVMLVIQGLLLNPSPAISAQTKVHASKVCELWCDKRLPHRESMARLTCQYLLKKSLQDDTKICDILRLWHFREALTLLDLRAEVCKPLGKFILQIPKNSVYMKAKVGQRLLAFIFTLDVTLAGELHSVIKEVLPTCTKSEAETYGHIYYLAWDKASPQVKKAIENGCIQNFMDHIFLFPRQGIEMNRVGQNVFSVLRYFHSQRKYAHLRLTLANLYEPLLWRHLSSGSSTIRCNAAQVLLDVYPLEKAGQGREENENYLKRQHTVMTSLLTDRNHFVRAITVRQLCCILGQYWVSIPAETIQKWMHIIMTDLANDHSTAIVRCSVYRGLPLLLSNPHAADYLTEVMHLIRNNFHDCSEKVRLAYTEMLRAVKNCQHQKLKFWHIVPLEHLVSRLAIEKETVGKRIVELIFESFVVMHMGFDITMKRISNLILMNRMASRKFFQYSQSCLKWNQAVDLVLLILPLLRDHVKSKMELGNSNINATPNQQGKTTAGRWRKRLYRGKENSSSGQEDLTEEIEDLYNKPTLENPYIAQGLLDIVGMLWTIHSHELEKNENKNRLKQLHGMSTNCIPCFLRYYEDDMNIYSSVLYLCSLIPIHVLKPYSTVESSCMSKLRRLTLGDSDDHCLMLVSPLCMWGCGSDIIEMAKRWMNEVFRSEKLNTTIQNEVTAKVSKGKKKKVNFQMAEDPKPRLGLRLLDTIFCHPANKTKVMHKNYEQVMDLFLYLTRIKVLIDRRMESNTPFVEPLLCDSFLRDCFLRYIKLIVLLKNDSEDEEKKFDPCDEFNLIFEWAKGTLIPHVPADLQDINSSSSSYILVQDKSSLPLAVELLKDVLHVATNMVAIGSTTPMFCALTGLFFKELLRTGCSLAFLQPVLLFMEQLLEYNNIYHGKNDEYHLFQKVIVNLLRDCLKVLIQCRYSQKTVTCHVQKFKAVKMIMFQVLFQCIKDYGSTSEVSISVIKFFSDTVVSIIGNEITGLGTVDPTQKLQDLPYLAAQLLVVLQLRTEVASLFLMSLAHTFNNMIEKDSVFMLSSLCLLHVLAFSPGKMTSKDLETVLQAAENAVESRVQDISDPAASESSVHNIDIAKESQSVLRMIKLKLRGVDSLQDDINIIAALEEELLSSSFIAAQSSH